MGSLIAAYSVAWTILMGYLWTLHARQRELRAAAESLRRQCEASLGGAHVR